MMCIPNIDIRKVSGETDCVLSQSTTVRTSWWMLASSSSPRTNAKPPMFTGTRWMTACSAQATSMEASTPARFVRDAVLLSNDGEKERTSLIPPPFNTRRATLAVLWCVKVTGPITLLAWWAGEMAAGRSTSLACTPAWAGSETGSLVLSHEDVRSHEGLQTSINHVALKSRHLWPLQWTSTG